ncbi:amidase [Xanthomonas sp. WHRI 1810A]|uniref:amidase n=1 Tax=Xanthomonas sp. WHRI 1810A TaxID=3161565 RepID=UPI0032E90233
MNAPSDPLDLSLTAARAALAAREVSSVELTQAALARAHALQGDFNAFIRFDDESALRQARAKDDLLAAGCTHALTGIPLAFKDMFYREGQVSTCGSKLREHWKAPVTAQVLDCLDNAGAVSLGTLNMTEFAYGPTGQNAWTGDARNPWNRDYISGGSSSGSAIAVATRMAFGTLGSDTAGSVRMPAALCGVTGMKTTYGLVSRFGCMPLSSSLDTVGPLTRNVQDNALLLSLIVGSDARDPATLAFGQVPPGNYLSSAAAPTVETPLAGLRIGMPSGYFDRHLDGAIGRILAQASAVLADAGALLVSVPMPAEMDAINAAGVLLNWGDVISLHGAHLRGHIEQLSPQTRGRMEVALGATAQDYLDAQRLRGVMLKAFCSDVFGACDVLLAPALSMPTPRLSDVDVNGGPAMMTVLDEITRLTRPANVLGLPALTLPCGALENRLPVGMQLMGRPFSEALLYRVGAAFEQRTPWHARSPLSSL